MSKSESESYRAAGVDITAGYRAVELMKKHVARTLIPGVLGDVGGFGGLFELDVTGYRRPVLVGGTDGVGTKLRLAFLLDRHDTVGIDCVAMCVNDIVCCGARPLFFLDYIACGKNVPEKIAAIVPACRRLRAAGCALIGGETAEMPGFYPVDEYDLAGFAWARWTRKNSRQNHHARRRRGHRPALLGVHSNGFSLVRKVFDVESGTLAQTPAELGADAGRNALTPTRIYVKPVLSLLER